MTELEFYIKNMEQIEKEIHEKGNDENKMFLTCVQFAIKTAKEVKEKLEDNNNE